MSFAGTILRSLCCFGWRHRRKFYGTAKVGVKITSGAFAGTGRFGRNLASFCTLSKGRIEKKKRIIEQQTAEYSELVSSVHDDIQDSAVIGGVLLSDIVSRRFAKVPELVTEAYQKAYPHLADSMSFKEAVAHYDGDGLQGLLLGVKGKLFEIQYVDYLNDGVLPDGFSAMLAESATQPGWDISISGPDGDIASLLQLKATDSVDYVREAMERYPDIDVVTTNEVHSQLVMHAIDSGPEIINSGISDAVLENTVNSAADKTLHAFDGHIPVVMLAIIAFSSYTKKDMDIYRKSYSFGERSAKAYLCYLAGGAAIAATGVWWVGFFPAMGLRLIAGRGENKLAVYRSLLKTIKTNKAIIRRYRKLVRRIKRRQHRGFGAWVTALFVTQ